MSRRIGQRAGILARPFRDHAPCPSPLSTDASIPPRGTSNERLHTVDALRGIAALAVVWYHLTYADTDFLRDGWFKRTGHYGGVAGVQAFFVISGFIIPYALHRAGYTLRSFFRFFAKRVTRLDPPYLVCVAVIIAMSVTRHHFATLRIWNLHDVSVPQVFAHLGYLNAVLGYRWLDTVYWTLGIELQYYLLIALLFPFAARLPRRSAWLVPAALVAGAWLPHPILETPFHDNLILSYLGVFAIGILTFQHRAGLVDRSRYFALLTIAAIAVYARLDLLTAGTAVATALAILFVSVSFRPLTWLGEFSYSLYLAHGPVWWVLYAAAMAYRPATQGWREGTACVTLAMALVVARGLYVAVERPAQRWSSRLRYVKPRAEVVAQTVQMPDAEVPVLVAEA